MPKYCIGIDYGTLSARTVLVNLQNGAETAVSAFEYPHGVMDKKIPSGRTLEKNSALQHPKDYLDAAEYTVREVIRKSGADVDDVLGIGIDFTSCTMLPVDEKGNPLCFFNEFENEPHAYVKLWKHHAAQNEANEITCFAKAEGEEWLDNYGGKISSEWMFPKILEIIHKCPEVYKKTARFIEAGDWVCSMLTGKEIHSSCMAGFKGMWSKKNGYPSNDFLKKLHSEFDGIVGTKISKTIMQPGASAGKLCKSGAELLGLSENTVVSVPVIDAHAALPAAGITDGGKMMLIIGTSTCHIMMSKTECMIDGICGVVEDGIVPGLYAYESGQACVGDLFGWYVENCLPGSYKVEAEKRKISIFELLNDKAKRLRPGESGLLVLDWWNGNRTPLSDTDLTGVILGLSLSTRAEEIYMALIEATAFGTRMIIEEYEKNGVSLDSIAAGGGIAVKNPFLMQIYSDVCKREIKISGSTQAPALGSAIFASVACGYYSGIDEATQELSNLREKKFVPNPENSEMYDKLYAEYKRLFNIFGKDRAMMKNLLSYKEEAANERQQFVE